VAHGAFENRRAALVARAHAAARRRGDAGCLGELEEVRAPGSQGAVTRDREKATDSAWFAGGGLGGADGRVEG
jgi:hypothetical protein